VRDDTRNEARANPVIERAKKLERQAPSQWSTVPTVEQSFSSKWGAKSPHESVHILTCSTVTGCKFHTSSRNLGM
jgi:hypothetical protein